MNDSAAGRKRASFILEYSLQSFGLIVVLAVLLRTFLLASYVMSSESMLPNVLPGDFLLAVRWNVASPLRGEVVVLQCPNVKGQTCMNRVVGLPGDRVEFRNGKLNINGQTADLKPLGSEFELEAVTGVSWATWPNTGEPTAVEEPVIVPPHHVYVLNDKRSAPEDSRKWGPISIDLIQARVVRVWLSLDWFERSGEVRNWPLVRWNRILRPIN